MENETTESTECQKPEPEQKRRRRGCCLGIVLILALLGVYGIAQFLPFYWGSGQPPVTISRETTYFTGPVRDDGSIDYFAVANRLNSEGVTPESNAAVPLSRVLDGVRHSLGDTLTCSPQYWELLDVDPPEEGGVQFVALRQFAKQLKEQGVTIREADPKHTVAWVDIAQEDKLGVQFGTLFEGVDRISPNTLEWVLDEQHNQVLDCKWSGIVFPKLVEWLELNSDAMAIIEEASHREHWFVPLVDETGSHSLLETDSPIGFLLFDLSNAFAMRAWLRLGRGETDSAWSDLMVNYRLSRLMASERFSLAHTLDVPMERHVVQDAGALIVESEMPAEWYEQRLEDLDRMELGLDGSRPSDIGRRCLTLDTIIDLATQRGGASDGLPQKMQANQNLNWNRILRDVNRWFDKADEIEKLPTFDERREKREEFQADRQELMDSRLMPTALYSIRNATSDVMTNFMLALMGSPRSHQDSNYSHYALTRMNCALALYRAKHGAYPVKLDQLVPDCIDELPIDPSTGQLPVD